MSCPSLGQGTFDLSEWSLIQVARVWVRVLLTCLSLTFDLSEAEGTFDLSEAGSVSNTMLPEFGSGYF